LKSVEEKPESDVNVIYMSQFGNLLIKVFKISKLQKIKELQNYSAIFEIYEDSIFVGFGK
jgi:hypothetical protein